jgi:hypothetical protein
VIYSDCWSSYNCLALEGYTHHTVNHSRNFKDPVTGVHTNSIEGTWQKIKHGATFPKFGVKGQHLGSYLAEFQWRCYHSASSDLWTSFVKCCASEFNGVCQKSDCGAGCASVFGRRVMCAVDGCSECVVHEVECEDDVVIGE